MLRVSNIRIGTKLAALSSITITLVLGLIASQLIVGNWIKNANENSDKRSEMSTEAALTKAAARGMRVGALSSRTAADKEALDRSYGEFQTAYSEFNAHLDRIDSLANSPARSEQIKKMKANGDIYARVAKELVDTRREMLAIIEQAKARYEPLNEVENAKIEYLNNRITKNSKTSIPAALDINKNAEEIVDSARKSADEAQAHVNEAATVATTVTVALGLLTVLIMVLAAFAGTAWIARPLRTLLAPLDSIADGNFAVVVPNTNRKDEVGQIASSVQQMADRVRAIIQEIKASGREVTNASAEISTSTTDLSQRTEEQAASLEETSAAMEELASTVRRNAENAQEASRSANDTRDVADRGGQIVAKTVEAMAKIEESSRKISDIIGVIDEIARQTNLLALNAAVEAARAGEAGRGFAVVASEVRSLAQRSSQAAKDIKDLITNSNGQVKDGVDLVNRAGHSLTEIVESIKKVAMVVSEIANASSEQATGIDQINRALTQMDEATQQNSALVEENAATAKTLEYQAKTMDEQVAFFQLGQEERAASRATSPIEKAAKPAMAKPTVAKAVVAPVRPAAAKSASKLVVRLKHTGSGGAARKIEAPVADTDWKEF
ncbi:methyl-accepting chemotaxis protein [Pseudolabrys sp. FHR47]|uniref:methyl-accepting chemotaxis protein n=1 Tax=Pseudolabrys sp. FHR47 TaxID=2562284 RepID=UPI0010BECECA|nr:methyl-accepting chemotaxis protein [Pseudolabrys sp. FHR47]